jgi:hypothetical protein
MGFFCQDFGLLTTNFLTLWVQKADAELIATLEEQLRTFLQPKIVVILSGKRKSGKDYIAEKLSIE